LGAVMQPVLDRHCAFAVMSALPEMPLSLVREQLQSLRLIHVAAAQHPLAAFSGPVPTEELARHVQLVLTDRSNLTAGREFGVFSSRTWRLADLGAKHAFLLAGLGWGGMPADRVDADLLAGRLVELQLSDAPAAGFVMPWY